MVLVGIGTIGLSHHIFNLKIQKSREVMVALYFLFSELMGSLTGLTSTSIYWLECQIVTTNVPCGRLVSPSPLLVIFRLNRMNESIERKVSVSVGNDQLFQILNSFPLIPATYSSLSWATGDYSDNGMPQMIDLRTDLLAYSKMLGITECKREESW